MPLWDMGLSGTRAPLECIDELSKSQCWSKGFGRAVRIPLLLLLRSLHAQRILTTAGSRDAHAASHGSHKEQATAEAAFATLHPSGSESPLKRRQEN